MTEAHSQQRADSGAPYDVALVGAGFANGLIAAAVLHQHPGARVAVIDRRPDRSFNQTWCFHESDVPTAQVWSWLAPFVSHVWPGYDVAFPKFQRGFEGSYMGISGDSFGKVMEDLCLRPTVKVFRGQAVTAVEWDHVTLEDGRQVFARVILDGRGAVAQTTGTGFQKFVGWEVDLEAQSCPLPTRPLLMDAQVDQVDGYRFFYVLPLGSQRFLIEDTYFSSRAELSVAAVEARLSDYIAQRGWRVRQLVRQEQGVLRMPWVSDERESPFAKAGFIQVGYRGGWYQPATGYSVPLALRVAHAVAGVGKFETPLINAALEPLWRQHKRQAAYYRLLNRLAFRGVKDEDRLAVFQRFYRLPAALVARFYAGQSTWWDKARILGGRPPVPLSRFQMARLMEEVS